MSVSQCRLNLHTESVAGLNRQINMKLHASFSFQSMAVFFDRDNVALPGFARYFKKASDVEREQAETLIAYMNKRGGVVVLTDIKKPERDDWGSGLDAMSVALQLVKSVNQSLLDLTNLASSHDDYQMVNFLESEFLNAQVSAIKEIGDHLTNLRRAGAGVGEYLYDKDTLSG